MIPEPVNGEPQKWFTAKDLAEMKLPGFPQTKRMFNLMASRENWLFRENKGLGGSRREVFFASLPESLQLSIIKNHPEIFTGISSVLQNVPAEQPAPPQENTHEELWRRYCERPDKEKKIAEDRLSAVNRVFAFVEAEVPKTEAVAMVANETGVSQATLYNWLSRIKGVDKTDWLPSLLGKWQGCQVETECSPEAYEFIKSDYLRLEGPAWAACYIRLERKAEKEGWIVPPSKTLLARLRREVDPRVIILARAGEKVLERTFPAQVRDKSGLHPLECDADGHTMDINCRWPDGYVGRPEVLVFRAVQSGKVVGWRVDKTENCDSIRLAYADVVENFGIPPRVYFDNGRAFTSKWLTGGVKNRYRFKIKPEDPVGVIVGMGSEVGFTRPGHGQSKPAERFFRELEEYAGKHPACAGAYTGNNPLAKPENYGSRAVDLDVFLKVLDDEIKACNARTGRRSPYCSGRSFDEAFYEAYEKSVIKKATKEQRGLLLLAAEGVTVSRYDGSITIDGNRYWNEKTAPYCGQKVVARLDPQNLHAGVFVYTLDNSFICAAECVQPAGFKDTQAAREHAKLRRRNIKATKRMLENERRMSALQVAARLPQGEAPEVPEAVSAKVVAGLFEEKIGSRKRRQERIDALFQEAIDKSEISNEGRSPGEIFKNPKLAIIS